MVRKAIPRSHYGLPPAEGAVPGSIPPDQPVQLCTPVAAIPSDTGWLSEARLSGLRILAWKQPGRVRLRATDGRDWADSLPGIAGSIRTLATREAVLDGIVVSSAVEGHKQVPHAPRVFHVFDLLGLNGWDLRGCLLPDRKRLLVALDALEAWTGLLQFSNHYEGAPSLLGVALIRGGGSGIVCKRPAPYSAGASGDWVEFRGKLPES
jgi:bifunctional non-homologous end joining protein LigD